MNDLFDYGLRFDPKECAACGGACCRGRDGFVLVETPEIITVSDFLGISAEEFLEKFTRFVDGIRVLDDRDDDDGCVFLDHEGRCSIYPVRPVQCRTYPFWPGNMRSPDAWNKTAEECPAIGKGDNRTLCEVLDFVWLHIARYKL